MDAERADDPAGGDGFHSRPAGPEPLDEERIRERAFRIWIDEGRPHGRDVEHWLRARDELEPKAA